MLTCFAHFHIQDLHNGTEVADRMSNGEHVITSCGYKFLFHFNRIQGRRGTEIFLGCSLRPINWFQTTAY